MNPEIQARILELRLAIRQHRDQKGDDRCWLDDFQVWEMLGDSIQEPSQLPSYDEMMQLCGDFFRFRRTEAADPMPENVQTHSAFWDQDLETMGDAQGKQEIEKMEQAIRLHRDIAGRQRTFEDDRLLYAVLPEKVPADFRLPPENEFLGSAKQGAGCPSFWKSHQNCACKQHNLHRWGPCK